MDFSIFHSLKECSLVEVKDKIKASKENVEFYVDHVDPESLLELEILNKTNVYLTTTSSVLEETNETFVTFFHQVLYKSLKLDMNHKKFKIIKTCKNLILIVMAVISVILAFMSISDTEKSTLFFMMTAFGWGYYRLYRCKIKIEVSDIQRATHFKLVDDNRLENLPAVYILDNHTIYMGSNLLGNQQPEIFYLVESFEEQTAIKMIYRDYAKRALGVSDELLITKYLRIVGGVSLGLISHSD